MTRTCRVRFDDAGQVCCHVPRPAGLGADEAQAAAPCILSAGRSSPLRRADESESHRSLRIAPPPPAIRGETTMSELALKLPRRNPRLFLALAALCVARAVPCARPRLRGLGGDTARRPREPPRRRPPVLPLRHPQGAAAAHRHRLRHGHGELLVHPRAHPRAAGRAAAKAWPTSWPPASASSPRSAPARRCRCSSASSRPAFRWA